MQQIKIIGHGRPITTPTTLLEFECPKCHEKIVIEVWIQNANLALALHDREKLMTFMQTSGSKRTPQDQFRGRIVT